MDTEGYSRGAEPPDEYLLDPRTRETVQTKVQTGRYNTPSEVVREALRLMEERDQLEELCNNEIRKKIAEGLNSLSLGKGIEGEAVFSRIEAELDALDRNSRA